MAHYDIVGALNKNQNSKQGEKNNPLNENLETNQSQQ